MSRYGEIHIIDDEDFYLDEAKLSLEDIGYKGKVYYYKTAEDFLRAEADITCPAVLVVDYDLGPHTVLEAELLSQIKNNNVSKKVLMSILDLRKRNIKGFDLICEKQSANWELVVTI
jgi:FixJ family two-component response regulator